MAPRYGRRVDLRKEKVVIETDRYRIDGHMTLPAEGFGSRLSDHLNRHETGFITVQDALLTPLDGGEPWQTAVLMVSSIHIRLIAPASTD